MPYARSPAVLGVGLAVLALVAHLWMLDRPFEVGPPLGAGSSISESVPPMDMPGCGSGMAACQVPMPLESLAALIGLAVIGRWCAGMGSQDLVGPMPTAPAPSERAPPPRPCVPASVVLLV